MSVEPSSNTPTNLPGESISTVETPADVRARRRAERHAERRSRRGGGAWILGAILIVLGLGFLAQSTGLIELTNWWALFILIPALGSFAVAWRRYQDAGGEVTSRVLASLIGGIVLSAITLGLLFQVDLGLSWNLIWPLLLILGGLALLLQAMTR